MSLSHTHTHMARYLFSLHVIVGVLGMESRPPGSVGQEEHRQNANDVHKEVHGPEKQNNYLLLFPSNIHLKFSKINSTELHG